jgi:hypothetical protein
VIMGATVTRSASPVLQAMTAGLTISSAMATRLLVKHGK